MENQNPFEISMGFLTFECQGVVLYYGRLSIYNFAIRCMKLDFFVIQLSHAPV